VRELFKKILRRVRESFKVFPKISNLDNIDEQKKGGFIIL